MVRVNKYLRTLKPYKVASHKIWKVPPTERKSILKLDWNEATCKTPPAVIDRLKKLVDSDFLNLYPDTSNEELYDSLSRYLEISKEYIQYFGSSDSLHEYISRLYVTQGDEVLILWPSYDNLRLTLQVSGANIHFFEFGNNFILDQEAFERKIKSLRPKLVYICNPNNPTGTILSKKFIEHLVIKFQDTIFLIDEAYIEFDKDNSCKELVKMFDNILITRTLSKAFGLANIRFGYLLASKANIEAISKIRNPKNITTFAQEAAIGALSDIGYVRAYVEEVKKARDYFINRLNKCGTGVLKAYNSHGNFVLIDCFDNQVKNKLLRYLETNNIFIRGVNQSESLRNCVRVTIGYKAEMEKVLDIIEQFLQWDKLDFCLEE